MSYPRLEAYRYPGGSDLDMVVNYFWNIDLAEAIVPSLHALEVALRNTIHATMTQVHANNDMWFFVEGVLEPQQLKAFAEAYRQVYKKPAPISGRVVAQLMFGFWTAMLHAPYEQKIWSPNSFTALYAAFPYATKSSGARLSRHEIHDRFQLINEFRNRVFHYEKLYDWSYIRGDPNRPIARTADQDHADIHDALRWISPTLHQAIHAVDDFAQAWNSRTLVETKLKQRLGIT